MKDWHCGCCDKEFTTKKQAIAHCQRVHAESPEISVDQFGETWDPVLTRLCNDLRRARHNLKEAEDAALKAEERFQQSVQKLNAIVLILQR